MKTEILKIKGDWQEVVNDCRATVAKEELGREPSTKLHRASADQYGNGRNKCGLVGKWGDGRWEQIS